MNENFEVFPPSPHNTFKVPLQIKSIEDRSHLTFAVLGLFNACVRNRRNFSQLGNDFLSFAFFFRTVSSYEQRAAILHSITRILNLHPTEKEQGLKVINELRIHLDLVGKNWLEDTVSARVLDAMGIPHEKLDLFIAMQPRSIGQHLFEGVVAILVLFSVSFAFWIYMNPKALKGLFSDGRSQSFSLNVREVHALTRDKRPFTFPGLFLLPLLHPVPLARRRQVRHSEFALRIILNDALIVKFLKLARVGC